MFATPQPTQAPLICAQPLAGQSPFTLFTRETDSVGHTMHGRESIMLVDDDPAVRRLLARVLRSHGYAVTEAADGAEALALAAEHSRPFHLLLTDVMMPQVGGVELASRMYASGMAARVLFMTGYTDDPIEHPRLTEVLRKPFTLATLADAVRRALDHDA